MTDRVLLVGMMGSGKTTVGRSLATVLGWRYLDNDEQLRLIAGSDTRTVQARAGEAALRRAESAALSVALTSAGPLVASVAAGVVLDALDPRAAARRRFRRLAAGAGRDPCVAGRGQ